MQKFSFAMMTSSGDKLDLKFWKNFKKLCSLEECFDSKNKAIAVSLQHAYKYNKE